MNEEQLKGIMWESLAIDPIALSINSGRLIIQKAIELAKEQGLLTSTETEDTLTPRIYMRVRELEQKIEILYSDIQSLKNDNKEEVMWDKNEPYGAVKSKEMCLIVNRGLTCSLEIDHEGPCDFV